MDDYRPLPFPHDDCIDTAARDLARMSEVDGLVGGIATFRRPDLVCTGWWTTDDDYVSLGGIDLPVPRVYGDDAWARGVHLENCRLAIRHAVERDDLERAQMRRVVEEKEAPRRERPELELVEED